MQVLIEPTQNSPLAASSAGQVAPLLLGRIYRDRLLRLADVRFMTGLGKSSIYAAIAEGTFPAAVNVTDYAVAWRESEIDAWIASRTKVVAEPAVPTAPPTQRARQLTSPKDRVTLPAKKPGAAKTPSKAHGRTA